MIGLQIFHNTIGGSKLLKGFVNAGLWALGGRFRDLTNVNSWWYNGATYSVGYETNATNNKVWILKQQGGNVTSFAVNNGTSVSEPLNHPTPLIVIDENTGFIYVIQNQFHVDAFEVWRSNTPENINGFSSVGTFDTDGSYLNLIKHDGGTNCIFSTRSGDSSTNGYDYNIVQVDLSNLGSFTDNLIVEMDFSVNNVRAYLIPCLYYGNITKYAHGVYSRQEGTNVYYKASVLTTTDFVTHTNISNTFSKNAVATPITFSELNTNFNVVGSDADRVTSIAPFNLIQIDNDIFISYRLNSNTMRLEKYIVDTTGLQASYDLPYNFIFDDSQDGYVYMYWNGFKIVCTAKIDIGVTKLFSIDRNLGNVSEFEDLDLPDGAYIGFPQNLDDVQGFYMISSRSQDGLGNVPYLITNRKFN